MGSNLCRLCKRSWTDAADTDIAYLESHEFRSKLGSKGTIWSPGHMKTDDLWFRGNVPGAGVRTPGEAKSKDDLDWTAPAQGEQFANRDPDELNKLVTLLEKEGPKVRIYGEGVILQRKLKFFRLRVADRECGVVLPNGESEKLGDLHCTQ